METIKQRTVEIDWVEDAAVFEVPFRAKAPVVPHGIEASVPGVQVSQAGLKPGEQLEVTRP